MHTERVTLKMGLSAFSSHTRRARKGRPQGVPLCGNCGYVLPGGSKFCPNCEVPVESPDRRTPEEKSCPNRGTAMRAGFMVERNSPLSLYTYGQGIYWMPGERGWPERGSRPKPTPAPNAATSNTTSAASRKIGTQSSARPQPTRNEPSLVLVVPQHRTSGLELPSPDRPRPRGRRPARSANQLSHIGVTEQTSLAVPGEVCVEEQLGHGLARDGL